MNYAVELAKEEFGFKPRGTTPPLEPLKEVNDEDRHFEEDRSHPQEKVLLQGCKQIMYRISKGEPIKSYCVMVGKTVTIKVE